MRYLIILALVVPAGCGLVRGGDKTADADPKATAAQAQVSESGDLSESVAGSVVEDAGVTGLTGLTGPARTVAGLGDPSRPGLWLETPLVQSEGQGRVRLLSGGASVAVTLLPAPGPATAGSRLSLSAMRQLGAPLSDLVELEVSPVVAPAG